MEINFQQQQQQRTEMPSTKTTKTKGRNKIMSSKNKFIGVRRRASGRWVAEIKDTTKKIRMWLGTFETPEEAAHAYDQAARLLRGSNTRTNFAITQGCASSPLASRIRNLLNSKRNGAAPKKAKQQVLESLESCRDLDRSASIVRSDDSALTCTTSATSSSSLDHTDANITYHDQDPSSVASAGDKMMMTMEQLFDGFDDVYKPDMSDCTSSMGELEGNCMGSVAQPGSTAGGSAWGYDCCFSFAGTVQELLLDFQPESRTICDHIMMKPVEASSEFERMKVERQISASLYAINGVHECMEKEMEALHYGPYPITDHGALLWDLPPLCNSLSI